MRLANSVVNMYIGCVNSVVITISHLGACSCYYFTTDCLHHTAEMVVVDTIWQLHTLIVMNSCMHDWCIWREASWEAIAFPDKFGRGSLLSPFTRPSSLFLLPIFRTGCVHGRSLNKTRL